MTKRSGSPSPAGGWDVIQSRELDGLDAIRTLAERYRAAAELLDAVAVPNETSNAFGLNDADRLRAALRTAGTARDDLDYWTRVLAEVAIRDGLPKQQIARALGVTTQTIRRWAEDPLGWNWPSNE